MTALFMVRAEVNGFPSDQGVARLERVVNPEVHIAFYEFPDLTAAQLVLDSDTLKGLIADFDRAWGTKVSRTRELVPTRQQITT